MHVLISQSVNRMASLAFWLAISDLSTRSSALAVFTALSLIGLAVLGVLYYRKSQLQGAVDAQFRGFREKAVALMDQIDSLRQRHKTLPSTDPDFTAPMTGATLALYNQVEHDLDDLWSRWLEVMETWNQVERQIRAGSGLTLKPTEEARKLIGQGGIDTLLRRSSACRQKLDRLNQGHEQAREALAAGRAELKALHDAPELLDRHDRAEEIARQVASSERLFAEPDRHSGADRSRAPGPRGRPRPASRPTALPLGGTPDLPVDRRPVRELQPAPTGRDRAFPHQPRRLVRPGLDGVLGPGPHACLLHAVPALGHRFARRPGHPGGILDPLANRRLLVLVRHVAKVALRRGGCVAKSMGQTTREWMGRRSSTSMGRPWSPRAFTKEEEAGMFFDKLWRA